MSIFDRLKKAISTTNDLPLYARPNEKIATCLTCSQSAVIHKSEMRTPYYCRSCKSD